MTVIPKENVKINPYSRHVEIRNLNGDKYILEDEKPLKNENNIEKEALKKELEYAHRAQDQAIEINYKLANRISELNKEKDRLNEEINELNKLYRKALDENRELEQMNEIMMKLVYIFTKGVGAMNVVIIDERKPWMVEEDKYMKCLGMPLIPGVSIPDWGRLQTIRRNRNTKNTLRKRRKKRPDKRLTMAQCEKEINDALDTFEKAALEALHSEFGFGKNDTLEECWHEKKKNKNALLYRQVETLLRHYKITKRALKI